MFEKNAFTAARTIYFLIIGICAAWLTWVFVANLPFWLVLILLPLAFAFAAAAGAPLAAAAAGAGGLAIASIAFIWRKAFSGSRSGA